MLADFDFQLERRNFAPMLLSYRDPHFALFGGVWFSSYSGKCRVASFFGAPCEREIH